MFKALKNSHPQGDSIAISYDYVFQPECVHSPLFSEVYSVYKAGFPHGYRQPDFFARMFALNRNGRAQRQWGPAHYEVAYAHREGKILGTAMYHIIAAPRRGWPDSPYHAAVGIDYRSVLPEARGRGIAAAFEEKAIERAILCLQTHRTISHADEAKVFVFNERARSLAMPFGDLADDVRLAKINPFNREVTWNKAGLLPVIPSPGIPFYIEGASSDGEPRCDYYSLNVKIQGKSIGARTIEDILMRYAALRRMNGGDPCQDKAFAVMIGHIRQVDRLTPVDNTKTLNFLRPYADELLNKYPAPIPDAIAKRRVSSLIQAHFRLVVPDAV